MIKLSRQFYAAQRDRKRLGCWPIVAIFESGAILKPLKESGNHRLEVVIHHVLKEKNLMQVCRSLDRTPCWQDQDISCKGRFGCIISRETGSLRWDEDETMLQCYNESCEGAARRSGC